MITKKETDEIQEKYYEALHKGMMKLEEYMDEKIGCMNARGRHGKLLVGVLTDSGPQAVLLDTRTYIKVYHRNFHKKFGGDVRLVMRHIPYQGV